MYLVNSDQSEVRLFSTAISRLVLVETQEHVMANAEPVPILLTVRELDIGGIQRIVTQIATGLDRSRFKAHVATYRTDGIRVDELRRAGVPILHLAVSSLKSPTTLLAAMRLGRYIRANRIRLVHSYDSSVVFVAPLARAFGVPAILSSTLGNRDLLDDRSHRQVRWTDKIVDTIVVNCEAMHRHMVDGEHVAKERVELCYSGVDTAEFHPATDQYPGRSKTLRFSRDNLCTPS